MRHTLMRTSAPIFNSLRRIAPQVALANWVCCRARRRSAPSSTQAIEANYQRSWLARRADAAATLMMAGFGVVTLFCALAFPDREEELRPELWGAAPVAAE